MRAVTKGTCALGAGDAHIGQTALFFYIIGFYTALMGQNVFFNADQETCGNSSPLAACKVIKLTWSLASVSWFLP